MTGQVGEHRDDFARLGVRLSEGVGRHAEIDASAGQHFRGPKVGRGRGVRLDDEIGRRVASRLDAPARRVKLLDLPAKGAHGGDRQIDIAARADLAAGQRHFDRAIAEGGCHQQRRHVLA
jgi:hypothetical protein